MKRSTRIATSLLSFGLAISALHADPVSVNPRPRSEAMGNAGVANYGDKDSAIMNPAGLADVTGSKFQLFNPLIEAPYEVDTLNSFLDYEDVRSKDSSTTLEKRAAFDKFVREVASNTAAMRVNLYPSWTRHMFHVGLLVDVYADPKFRLGGLTSNQVVELGGSNGTVGFILGSGYGFMDNQLQVGLTLKPMYRVAITKEQSQTLHDILRGQNAGAKTDKILLGDIGDQKGFGVGIDLGVKYIIPKFNRVMEVLDASVGATLQDIGNTRFVGDHHLPADIDQSLSVGASIQPKLSVFKNTVSLDFRNLLEEQDFMNKFHLGIESVVWDLLIARVGLSQGYMTGGIGLETRFFELDAYVTAKEAGESAHIQEVRTIGLRLAAAF